MAKTTTPGWLMKLAKRVWKLNSAPPLAPGKGITAMNMMIKIVIKVT